MTDLAIMQGARPKERVLGLKEYRAGRHAKAVMLFEQGILTSTSTALNATALAVLCMAYHADGKLEAAKATLTRARAIISPNWPGRANDGDWDDWLLANLYLQDAEKLIASPAQPQGRK